MHLTQRRIVHRRLADKLKFSQDWRPHDLRRSCASGMQRLGVPVEVIERALNHVSVSFRGVAGVYQRDPMTEQVQAALQRWANHIEQIVSGKAAKVVPMRGRRR